MNTEPPGSAARVLPRGERGNVFALVIYVPGPLGKFLDDLRRELVPHYNPRAHVSVLPPRPLSGEWEAAGSQLGALAAETKAFEIELTTVEIFPATDVIYLEVGAGGNELRQLHESMGGGPLAFDEPFAYQPHITLAQDLRHEDVGALHELAARRWREFPEARSFRAERAVFVQNQSGDSWVDLAEYTLSGADTPRLPRNGQRNI